MPITAGAVVGAARVKPYASMGGSSVAQPAAFNPASLGSVALWFDARSLSLAEDAAISAWSDLSGNARNISQPTGAKQPLYKGASPVGPAALFDGAGKWLPTNWQGQLTAASIYIAAYQTAQTAGGDTLLGETNTGNGRFGLGVDSTAGTKLRAFVASGSTVDTTTTGPTMPAINTGFIASMTFTASTPSIRLNGGASTTTAAGGSANLGDGAGALFWNMGSYDTSSTFTWSGGIGIVLVYAALHDDATRRKVERYLGRRCNVSVA